MYEVSSHFVLELLMVSLSVIEGLQGAGARYPLESLQVVAKPCDQMARSEVENHQNVRKHKLVGVI